MTFYCTHCWGEVAQTATACPHCGDDIAACQARTDYADKLIAALHHPEPTTPIRAAWILGQRRERKAVEPLCALVRESHDPFIAASAASALGAIGGPAALETLQWAATSSQPRLRAAARHALTRVSNEA